MGMVHKKLGTAGVTAAIGTVSVSNVVIASNICTLTVPAGHGLIVGDVVNVAGVNAAVDGARSIASSTSTTVTFAVATTTLASVACVGVCEVIARNGGVLVSSFRADGTAATITTSSNHGRSVGDLIQVGVGDTNIDGVARIIAVPTSTTLVVPTLATPYTLASVSRAGAIGVRMPAPITVYTCAAANGSVISSLRLTNIGSTACPVEVLVADVVAGQRRVQLLAPGDTLEALAGVAVGNTETVKVRVGGPNIAYVLTGMESS